MKFGMNLLLWSGDISDELLPVLEKLKAMGYDGVELPIFAPDVDKFARWGKRLDAYYRAIDSLDVAAVERAVNQIAPRPARDLGRFIGLFSQERFLSDYTENAKLLIRLNQVMRRVGLAVLPPSSVEWLAVARTRVAERKGELLSA